MKKVPLSEVTCPWCGEVMDGVKRVDNVRAADGMHSGIQCNHCGVKMASDVLDLENMMLDTKGQNLAIFGDETDEKIEGVGVMVSDGKGGFKRPRLPPWRGWI